MYIYISFIYKVYKVVIVNWIKVHEEQRASTNSLHFTRSLARIFAWFQVIFRDLHSFFTILIHVFRGLPGFLWPCGFQSSACLAISLGGLLRMWPIQVHLRLQISDSIGLQLAIRSSCSFVTQFGQKIRRICFRHLLQKDCSFLRVDCVVLQVLQPYSSTALTLLLKIFSFVVVVMLFALHILCREWKAVRALFILSVISALEPPSLQIVLPRYEKEFTSSISCPWSVSGDVLLVPIRINLVFFTFILSPTLLALVDRCWIFCAMSSKRCAKRHISSA